MNVLPLKKKPIDVAEYVRRTRQNRKERRCFVCSIVARTHDYPQPIVYEDDHTIAFLSKDPPLLGYCLVAPRRHVEDWVHDLGSEEYVALQRIVQRVATAVAAVIPTERMYLLSLGSQQGNAHVHWHVAPLPPGVPYEEQQFHALMAENGVLDVTHERQAAIAEAIARHL